MLCCSVASNPTWRAADDQHCIVVDPPCFDLGARILDRREQRDVQTLIAQPTGFKVMFLNPDTAIMTHATKGADAHYSLHVWSRKGGTWQIVATSMTNAKSGK